MKKSYRKPLVYCENYDTGIVISNSEKYEQEMKRKLAELKIEINKTDGHLSEVENIMIAGVDV